MPNPVNTARIKKRSLERPWSSVVILVNVFEGSHEIESLQSLCFVCKRSAICLQPPADGAHLLCHIRSFSASCKNAFLETGSGRGGRYRKHHFQRLISCNSHVVYYFIVISCCLLPTFTDTDSSKSPAPIFRGRKSPLCFGWLSTSSTIDVYLYD